MSRLSRHGVRKLEPKGQKFDPNFHEALFEVQDETVPPGTVAQVVEEGFAIGERVSAPGQGRRRQGRRQTKLKPLTLLKPGLRLYKTALDRAEQEALLADLRAVLREAPLFRPTMPRSGKQFSVRMSNCGPLGWVSDLSGYRYQNTHPETGLPWPPMPEQRACGCGAIFPNDPAAPDACLINFYDEQARMGAHQDRDEADFSAPILSLSLGSPAASALAANCAADPTQTIRLDFGRCSRLRRPGAENVPWRRQDPARHVNLLTPPGRINLTLRRAE